MLIRAMLFALTLLPLPAAAQDFEENEALLMRLTFDDCAGFVKDGIDPFDGLETEELSAEEKSVVEHIGKDVSATVIQNRTYFASWGTFAGIKICIIFRGFERQDQQTSGIPLQRLLDQADLRAEDLGLLISPQDTDSGFVERDWIEAGVDRRKALMVSMTLNVHQDVATIEGVTISMSLPPLLN